VIRDCEKKGKPVKKVEGKCDNRVKKEKDSRKVPEEKAREDAKTDERMRASNKLIEETERDKLEAERDEERGGK
jgi:hypothetical protein